MDFAAILLTALVWLPNGDMQPPITRAFANGAECKAAAMEFIADITDGNNANPYPMRMTYHVDCRAITNTSEAKGA
jgi:hypothetical protein